MRDASATRRRVLGLLAGLLGGLRPAWPAPDEPGDRGIGGTGARPVEDETPSDRGIGGTGVIGTIRRFGSIVVNDLRIAYPGDAQVRIDGAPARIADLRIGQVVRVVAQGEPGALSTRRIDVTSEVVGPVEAAAEGRLTVLGQTVATAAARGADAVAPGQRVAVYGLRRPDGTIAASLIEPRPDTAPDAAARIAGPVRKGADGVPAIGGLKLDGLDAGLVGRRVVVEGRPTGSGLAVASARDASRPFGAGVARASIEGYVTREGGDLRFGSGLRASDAQAGTVPREGARAVVTTGIGRDGRLSVDAVRAEGRGRFEAPGRGSGQGPGQGPGPGQAPGGAPGRSQGQTPGRGAGPDVGPRPDRGAVPGRDARPGGERSPPVGSGGLPGRDGYRIDTRPGPGGPAEGPGGGFGAGGFGGPGGAPGGLPGGGPGLGGGPGFGGGGFGGGGLGGRGGR